jgi:transposase
VTRKSAATNTVTEQLAASRRVIADLQAENAELKTLLVEMGRALDAAQSDVARYRALCEQSRPNCPERVPSAEQKSALADVLSDLGESFRPTTAANDPTIGAEACNEPAPPQDDAEPLVPRGDREKSGDKDREKTGGSHGRTPLGSSKLPVRCVIVDPPEVLATGGVGFTLVGSETSDRIARSPALHFVLRIVRRTYRVDTDLDGDNNGADDADDTPPPDALLVTAPIPGALWPRVLADPSAIAHAIVAKYDDLLPLHRQEGISRREGHAIPRSTSGGWFDAADRLVGPVVEAMFDDAKKTAPYIATDATSASVRTDFAPCDPWSVFVFVAEQDHVVFRYAHTHDSTVLRAMLKGYRGYLLGDATSIYSPLVTAGLIVLVCCWAHVRRYFYKALDSERARATAAIAIIGQLFEVERKCSELVGAEKTARRADLARPILTLFDAWLARERGHAEDRTPLKAAITYADNQHEQLRRFLADGRLRLDNNVCEGLLRKLVLGLNNWQYFESETGLRWYTHFRSLIASCQLQGLCPQRYLECLFRLAPHWPKRRLLDLSPKYWRATAQTFTPEQLAIVNPEWSSAFEDLMAMSPKPARPSQRPHRRKPNAAPSPPISAILAPDERVRPGRDDATDRSRLRRRYR